MFKLTQEIIATGTVGLTLATLVLTLTGFVISSTNDIRAEARADRAAWQAEAQSLRDEARADREAAQAEAQSLRDEARVDREAAQAEAQSLRDEARADREAFEKHIIRLTRQQSQLTGIVEQMRAASR